MSVFKCCPPHLFHGGGLVPVGSTVVNLWGGKDCRCWNSGSDLLLTSVVDTSGVAKTLQPSRIPEEWTPPSVSVAPLLLLLSSPLQHSSLYFPPRPGWDTKKSSTVYTCCNTLPQTKDRGKLKKRVRGKAEQDLTENRSSDAVIGRLVSSLTQQSPTCMIPECRPFKKKTLESPYSWWWHSGKYHLVTQKGEQTNW